MATIEQPIIQYLLTILNGRYSAVLLTHLPVQSPSLVTVTTNEGEWGHKEVAMGTSMALYGHSRRIVTIHVCSVTILNSTGI